MQMFNKNRRPPLTKFKLRVLCTMMALAGSVLLLLAVAVHFTQNNQIEAQAQITNLSNSSCKSKIQVANYQSAKRCSLDITFSTASGQVIHSSVVDAFPSEITQYPDGTSTIQVRYDKNNPNNIVKQSNFMTTKTSVGLGLLGVLIIMLSVFLYKFRVKKVANS